MGCRWNSSDTEYAGDTLMLRTTVNREDDILHVKMENGK